MSGGKLWEIRRHKKNKEATKRERLHNAATDSGCQFYHSLENAQNGA